MHAHRSEDSTLMMTVEVGLIWVYLCVLMINTCALSEEVCASYGLRSPAKGVDAPLLWSAHHVEAHKPHSQPSLAGRTGIYRAFLFSGLSMIGLLLAIAFGRCWIEGNLPQVVLVARAHSISPWTVIRKYYRRRLGDLVARLHRALGWNEPHLSLRTVIDIYRFRKMRGSSPSRHTPEAFLAIANGNAADVCIDGVFPRTSCFVQV